MHLIVGLGNPGEKYKDSRHNVGFILLDAMQNAAWEKDKYSDAEVSKSGDSIFVKPLGYMNNSGNSVKYLSDKNSVPSENVIVIHDDIDMPFGTVRIVFDSGTGGHNGVRSITERLGTNKFVRIKIGIAPKDADGKAIKPKPGLFQSQKSAVSRYVLKDFSKADLSSLATLSSRVREIVDTIIKEGHQSAMNKFN